MQFVWPFKAAYLIAYLDENYETTVIGVPDRDYVWIMARTKTIPETRYQELVKWLRITGMTSPSSAAYRSADLKGRS
jgi:apolipoprotein D and lipocalin family protein